jgi:predicted transcriptional regulator
MSLPNIAPAELELLRYILDHHPITVREVADHVAQAKGHTRTTVLNVMERLRRKGYLTRRQEGGLYQYSPSVPKLQMQQTLVRDFVRLALGGSLEPFMAYLTQEADVSDAELADLKQLVDDLDRRPKKDPPPQGEDA